MSAWLPHIPGYLWHHVWPHVWPALVGAGVGQVVVYMKLKARIEVHHLAQLAHANRQAQARDTAISAAALARAGQDKRIADLTEAVGELADATRAVLAANRAKPRAAAGGGS